MKKVFLALLFITLVIGLIQPARSCVPQQELETNQIQEDLISTTLNTSIQLKINQSVRIESENLQITFLDVVEDSRCPTEITCVQAGQVKILFKISKNEQTLATLSLVRQVSQEELAVETVDGYTVKLTQVEPFPQTTEPINISDYLVTLIISQV